MKNFKQFFLLVCVLTSIDLLSQTYFSKNLDLVPNAGEVGVRILKTEYGYFLLTKNGCAIGSCTTISRFNDSLELLWTKTLPWLYHHRYHSLVVQDSSIFVTGMKDIGTYEVVVHKMNLKADSISTWEYPGPYNDRAIGIATNGKNGLFLLTLPIVSLNVGDVKIFNIDNTGNVIWEKTYPNQFSITAPWKLIATPDGGCALSATYCPNLSCFGLTKGITKIDSSGNVQYLLNTDQFSDYSESSLTSLPDNGIAFSRTRDTFEIGIFGPRPVVYKADSTGKIIWEQMFTARREIVIIALTTASNGDIIGVGINSNHTLYDSLPPFKRIWGGWIFRLSPNGELLWERIIGDLRLLSISFGALVDVLEMDDKSILATGSVERDTIQGGLEGIEDTWFVHVDSNGCLWPDCDRIQYILDADEPLQPGKAPQNLSLFPNPASEQIFFKMDGADESAKFQARIINVIGQTIKTVHFSGTDGEVNVADMPDGVVFIQVFERGKLRAVGKAIVAH